MTKLYLKITFILLFSFSLHAQDRFSLGISGMYNFPLQTFGAGIRAQLPLANRLSLVPQIKYMPSFNAIHEVYSGVNFHFNLLNNTISKGYRTIVQPQRPVVYLAAGVQYNRWIDYEKTQNLKAKQNNILPEAGLGIAAGANFIRVFAEVKYNILWKESYGEIGLMVYPFNTKQPRKNNCPKI